MVDLPEPDGPTSATVLPAGTWGERRRGKAWRADRTSQRQADTLSASICIFQRNLGSFEMQQRWWIQATSDRFDYDSSLCDTGTQAHGTQLVTQAQGT